MFTFNKRQATTKRRATRRRPCLEALEGRVVLSTLQVNTLLDTDAVKPSKSPLDKNNDISLRSAIEFADANPTKSFTINLPPGTITLDEGELSILVDKNLTIAGSTKGQTIISGNNQNGVFVTLSGNVSMSNLVIEHGQSTFQGGGLFNDGATDTLVSVEFLGDITVGSSGSPGKPGAPHLPGQPGSSGGDGEGGAICNTGFQSSLTLKNCSLIGNEAFGGDGGHGGAGTPLDVGISGFSAPPENGGFGGAGGAGGAGLGGGIFNGLHASLILSGDTFLKNEAVGGSGGTGGAGATTHGGVGTTGTHGHPGGGIGGTGTGGNGGAGGAGGLGAGAGSTTLAARSRS